MSDVARPLTAIGLMAGTSLDGVDAAIIETDGDLSVTLGAAATVPYPAATRAAIIRATKAALEGRDTAQDITDAAALVTEAHIAAIRRLLQEAGLASSAIDVIGFHGQTILHRSPSQDGPGRTWQIGGGGILSETFACDVVDQFRLADMAEGGEGAPLAPAYHRALAASAVGLPEGPVVVLNLGGVANLTFIPADRDVREMIAFDCGPGNGLLDEWIHLHTGASMDEGGAIASTGVVDEPTVRMMALNPYLRRRPPKSLDRYDFKIDAVKSLSVADGAATLTAFTALCVARGIMHFDEPPVAVVVCGGGRHNPVLMAGISAALDTDILAAEDLGWRGDSLEAEAFGYLAVRSLKRWPLSFPGTTRVPQPVTGGQIHRAGEQRRA